MIPHFILARAIRFKGPLAVIGVLGILSSFATLIVPWLAAQLLGGLLGGEEIELNSILALLIGALVCLTALNILSSIASEEAAGRILAELRREVYDHIQLLPIEYHNTNRSGGLLALMTYEVQHLSSFLTATLANIPAMLMTAAGSTLVLFLLDPALALLVPLLVPVFFVMVKLFGRRLRVISRQVRRAENDLISLADRDLELIPAIKTFAAEQEYSAHYAAAVEKARKTALREVRMQAFLGPSIALVAAISAIVLLVVSSDSLGDGSRTPQELFAFVLYAALLTRPIGSLANTYGSFQLARSTIVRVNGVLERPWEQGYTKEYVIEKAHGDIVFENIAFGYPGRPQVFSDLNLSIHAGEIVAFTGDNGVGKSTLIGLLLGLYRPHQGRIELDGTDIAQLQIQSLRRQFGYVPQRALLFNGTISQNITFGAREANSQAQQEALERAIELSQAGSFIGELPLGLETEIGDHGVRLSGGQRQKIALARALFRSPPIYILDEATSMYDLESEAAFVEACVRTLRGHTVIIITHRPASLALADRIIQIEGTGALEETQRIDRAV